MKPNNRYYCVIIERTESTVLQTFLYAAGYSIPPCGDLIFYRQASNGEIYNTHCFSPGQWLEVYPASVIDGSPVNTEFYRVWNKVIKDKTQRG